MNVKISLIGRLSVDDEPGELWAQDVHVGAAPVVVSPVIPAEAARIGVELRVAPADVAVSFALFRPAPAEDAAEALTLERASPVYAAFDHAPRQVPLTGTALALVAVGAGGTVPGYLIADADGVRIP